MADTVSERQRVAVPIKCAYGLRPYSVSFLKILRDEDRLRVMPTSLGKRKLPRFWTVWLEQLVLKKTEPHQQFYVSIDNHHVLIGADGVTPDGLFATISQLAAQVHPIKHLMLEFLPEESGRHGHHKGTGRAYYWRVHPGVGRVDWGPLKAVLPKGASLTTEHEMLKVLCTQEVPTPQHTKLLVEYHAALSLERKLLMRP